jgi:hypothetical protein
VVLIGIQGFWEMALVLVRLLVVVTNAGFHYIHWMGIQPVARDAATFVNYVYNFKKCTVIEAVRYIIYGYFYPRADRKTWTPML